MIFASLLNSNHKSESQGDHRKVLNELEKALEELERDRLTQTGHLRPCESPRVRRLRNKEEK